MVGASGDNGSTRRLPSWMLSATKQATNSSDNRDDKSCNLDEELVSEARKCMAEKQHGKSLMHKEKKSLEELSDVPSNSVKRRRRRRSDQEEEHGEASMSKKKYIEIGGKVRESVPKRKRKTKTYGCESNDHLEVQFPVDYEDDLTVEDLLSIAREYAKGEEDARLQRLTNRGCEPASESPSSPAFIVNEPGDSLIGIGNNPESSVHERNRGSKVSPSGELNITYTSRTGDAAQDMLNLFLGPLLKKLEQEKEIGIVAKDVAFAHEGNPNREKEIEEEIILQKKRSSLKERVSMLLD